MTTMPANQPNRPHPGVFPTDMVWDDEPRTRPLPVSGSAVSDDERQAELRRGLAARPVQAERPPIPPGDLDLDRRLSWEQLFEMFRAGKVSIKRATQWADVITARGVRRR